jgi:ATP/maltotriose-dependent transcriptional regulator MalT
VVVERGLVQARAAFAERAWARARQLYASAQRPDPADLEAWGLAAQLTGHDAEAEAVRERAHHAFLDSADFNGAARVAFWLGLSLLMRGEASRGRGWFARVRSVVPADRFGQSVWHGYTLLNDGMQALQGHAHAESLDLLGQAKQLAEQHNDLDLELLARNGRGQALLALGRAGEGMAELDQMLVLATGAGANPQAVGQVYCAAILVCRGCLDVERSVEWTQALDAWCATQPDLVPYRGQCLVHRSEVLQLRGDWQEASEEIDSVITLMSATPTDVATGLAMYQRGELHRVRGEFGRAEEAYREALKAGHDPQPGLALLRLAQGRAQTSLVSLRRALEENTYVFTRARLLPAAAAAAISTGELADAHAFADELGAAAQCHDSAYLRAVAAETAGAVCLAEGDAAQSLTLLRRGLHEWLSVRAPYEVARCRVLVARACRLLGDTESAQMEAQAAAQVFTELGAHHDLSLLVADTPGSAVRQDGLTPRELEVLRALATGQSNKGIAEQFVLSERTVARHVANIFVKIGVNSRTAATAYAYDHRLL